MVYLPLVVFGLLFTLFGALRVAKPRMRVMRKDIFGKHPIFSRGFNRYLRIRFVGLLFLILGLVFIYLSTLIPQMI